MELGGARPEQFALLETLPEFRRQGRLCDVKLKSSVDNTVFDAHRLILSLASEPLAALLSGPFAEGAAQTQGALVSLEATGETLRVILDFIYSGRARVASAAAVPDLLRTAHK